MKTISEYTIYCTQEQTKKARELGAPIEILPNYTEYRVFPLVKCKDGNERPCIIPTTEQMIGWLETQGLFISIDKSDGGHIFYKIRKGNKYICEWNSFSSRKEATLAAIGAALEYLKEQNK